MQAEGGLGSCMPIWVGVLGGGREGRLLGGFWERAYLLIYLQVPKCFPRPELFLFGIVFSASWGKRTKGSVLMDTENSLQNML